ncbi:hypothetical protein [Corynebacterium lizhenjunii]|uniref:hypothetical protein n=1 Tax=Corynebacterium lizhenjunii TaxID=2709394 RepID=UPI0013EDA71A|nr:hypothetical protein [Corynebacterium lizhenjunii]
MSQDHRLHQSSTFAHAPYLRGLPHLTVSNSTHSIALDIPPLAAEHPLEEPLWQVIATRLDGSTHTRRFFVPTGEDEALLVALPEPFTQLRVQLLDGEEPTGEVCFGGEEGGIGKLPLLLVDAAGRLHNPQAGLYPAAYRLFSPQGASAQLADAPVLRNAHAHGQWGGWDIATLDLTGAAPGQLRVSVPRHGAVTWEVTAVPEFEWDADKKTLPNARGLDHRPVFVQSPTLRINATEGQWSTQLVYVPVGGEPELISEEDVEPGELEVFPADAYEDPWVGRYEFTVFRDGEELDSRVFSIAEALHMRAKNEGPRGTGFRFIDAAGQLSPFSYTLASAPGKQIVFEKGTRTFGADETSRVETVSSEAGYSLDFVVLPATLRSRVKRTGAEPVEYFDKQLIYADQLDIDANFVVHAPKALPMAKFVAIDKRAKIKDLATTHGDTAAHHSVSVSNRTLRAALKRQSTLELYLLWSTLSYEDYLDSLSPAELATHQAQPPQRRVIEYEASASRDLIYAALATIKRTPLVFRAVLEEGIITVEQSGEEDLDLLGWAWPLAQPASTPVPLEPVEGGFAFPEELAGQGPLILDLREDEYLSDLLAPARPAPSALVMSVPDESADAEPATTEAASTEAANAEAHGTAPSSAVSADDSLADVWQEYVALRTAAHYGRDAPLRQAFKAVIERLHQEPGEAVEALVRLETTPPLRPAGKVLALVQTQLIAHPWDAPIEGSPELEAAAATGVDGVTRPLILMQATSDVPTPPSSAVCDEAARVAALRECFDRDADFFRLGSISHLQQNAQRLQVDLGAVGLDTSVAHTLLALNAFAGSDTPFVAAASMPYISYVYSLAFRAVANGLIQAPDVLALLNEDQQKIADVAELAPRLFAYDLRVAEALCQHRLRNR